MERGENVGRVGGWEGRRIEVKAGKTLTFEVRYIANDLQMGVAKSWRREASENHGD
jgi:hypothetical protein